MDRDLSQMLGMKESSLLEQLSANIQEHNQRMARQEKEQSQITRFGKMLERSIIEQKGINQRYEENQQRYDRSLRDVSRELKNLSKKVLDEKAVKGIVENRLTKFKADQLQRQLDESRQFHLERDTPGNGSAIPGGPSTPHHAEYSTERKPIRKRPEVVIPTALGTGVGVFWLIVELVKAIKGVG